MKAIKRYSVLLLIAFLLCLPVSAQAPSVPQSVEDACASVVHLYGLGYDEDGSVRTRWAGTGFAVGPAGEDSNTFLTNWHVATGSGKFPPERVRLFLLRDNIGLHEDKTPYDGIECQVLAATEGFPDVAVIRTSEPVPGCRALPLLSSRRVLDSEAVYSLGFPGLPPTHYGSKPDDDPVVVTAGSVQSHLRMKRANNTAALIHTAVIQPGNSGGPILNAQGVVVGQNTYGFERSVTEALFCALFIDYGMEMLDTLGIAYTTVPGPSRLTVFLANWLGYPQLSDWAAFVLAGVLLCLAVFFVRYFCKTMQQAYLELRAKSANAAPIQEFSETSDSDPAGSSQQ